VDVKLPESLSNLSQNTLIMLSACAVAAYATPWFLVPFVPLLYGFGRVQTYYRATARELKRMESVSRSPILSLFAATVEGAASIRAFKRGPDFQRRHAALVESHAQAFFITQMSNRWLAMRLDIGSSLVTLLVGGLSMATVCFSMSCCLPLRSLSLYSTIHYHLLPFCQELRSSFCLHGRAHLCLFTTERSHR
jgi:hypothetical protein